MYVNDLYWNAGDASRVTEDIIPQSTVPQELEVKTEITDLDGSTVPQEPAVKTEITYLDGSCPTLSPRTIDPEVVVKTKIIDIDESSPTFSPLLATCSESFVVRQSLSSKGIFHFLCWLPFLTSFLVLLIELILSHCRLILFQRFFCGKVYPMIINVFVTHLHRQVPSLSWDSKM